MFTIKSINKVFQEDSLPIELVKGEGYFYLIYDDVENNIYETQSIYTVRLSDMTKDRWVEEGRTFATETKHKMGIN